jgi:hypothetical protein
MLVNKAVRYLIMGRTYWNAQGIGAAVAVRAMPMAKRSCVICIFATLVVVSPSRDEWVGWMCGLTGERRERSGSRARRLIMDVNL